MLHKMYTYFSYFVMINYLIEFHGLRYKFIFIMFNAFFLFKESDILKELDSVLGSDKIDAVICVAGGWAGGSSSSKGKLY